MDKKDLPIGFLDSGVGGLSVMREAIKIMPNENYIYFGDSKNAPYGIKPTKEIRDLDAAEVAHHLRYIFIGCAFEESFNNGLTVEEVQKHLMFYYNIIKR